MLSEQVRLLATSHQIEFAPPNSITAALGVDQDCTQAAIELRCGNRYRVMLNRLAAKRKIFIFLHAGRETTSADEFTAWHKVLPTA